MCIHTENRNTSSKEKIKAGFLKKSNKRNEAVSCLGRRPPWFWRATIGVWLSVVLSSGSCSPLGPPASSTRYVRRCWVVCCLLWLFPCLLHISLLVKQWHAVADWGAGSRGIPAHSKHKTALSYPVCCYIAFNRFWGKCLLSWGFIYKIRKHFLLIKVQRLIKNI